MPTETFTSDSAFNVPNGVQSVEVTLEGGAGGDATFSSSFQDVIELEDGSDGGSVSGALSVSGGDTIYVRITAGGDSKSVDARDYGEDKGAIASGAGGASADIRLNGTSASDRVVVAAGGGGGAAVGANRRANNSAATRGGKGGADQGEDAPDAPLANGGAGGTQSSGGPPGGEDSTVVVEDFDSSFIRNLYMVTGAGGAGYYGGQTGGANKQDNQAGGGGGGSNYTGGLDSVSTNDRGDSTTASVSITYTAVPTLYGIGDSGTGVAQLNWSNTGAESYGVYRSTYDGGFNRIATVSGTSYNDNIGQGVRRYYRVSSIDGGTESLLSNTRSILTDLPAPTGLTVDAEKDDGADISWSASHLNGVTRVQIAEDDDGDWTTDQSVDPSVESATITGLLNGQLYGVRVAADTEDAFEVDQ
ncbi:glycine-rich protein [Halorubrum distributum]|uniref:receptor protein-tyrosine kinase n=1 Tax=Halorubrum distributum TaxID=29283 RepID=A0A6B1IKF8_9EURY|nr:fibronectin type III domain-containing protein [Halorubrum terrestre]MYL67780.1 hypothetical protein [Halorubrum terrestre]